MLVDVARYLWPPHGQPGSFVALRYSPMACGNLVQYIWPQECGNDDSVSICQKTIADRKETSDIEARLQTLRYVLLVVWLSSQRVDDS